MVSAKASWSVALPLLVILGACGGAAGGAAGGGGGSGGAATTATTTTTTPSAPTVTSPASSPYYSNGNSVTISGGCTTGATVSLEGASITTQTFTCASSSYTFSVSQSSDATYSFTVKQTVSGVDSATSSLSWIRDTAVSAPTITGPGASPYTSAGNSINIVGACETGATVSVAGDGTGSATCASSAYSISITKSSNATYNFTVSQTDLAGNTSGNTSFQWVRDNTVPADVAITSPLLISGVYYFNGNTLAISISCTTGLTVTLSGATAQNTTCTSSSYTFSSYNPGSDGTYNFTVSQTDRAGNPSASTNYQWIRDTASPTISSVTPSTSSGNLTTATNIALSGSGYKSSGMTITVGGATCANFSFTSSSSVSCDAPAPHLAQVVNVTVTKANGASVTSTGGFTYTGTATYTLLQQKVFQVYCASCHMGGNASGGLQLDVYSSISARVSAGDAAGSTLYQRVASDSMPQGGPALSTTEKNAIADWINAGANNN